MKAIRLILTIIFVVSSTSFTRAASVLDFDGDGRTDLAVVRTEGNALVWYIMQSTLGFRAYQWGIPVDKSVPADYDGDGKWDVAVWRPGTPSYFYILRSQTNSLQAVAWGSPDDDPYQTQDFDGDGLADPTVVRRTPDNLLVWYTLGSSMGFRALQFGADDDLKLRGDYDGDGKADIAVYTQRTAQTSFVILQSSNNNVRYEACGNFNTDVVLPADFDADGKTDLVVWRGRTFGPDAGFWIWKRSSDGGIQAFTFGSDINPNYPAPGSYNGLGVTNIALWQRNTASFQISQGGQNFIMRRWGLPTDTVLAFNLQARFPGFP